VATLGCQRHQPNLSTRGRCSPLERLRIDPSRANSACLAPESCVLAQEERVHQRVHQTGPRLPGTCPLRVDRCNPYRFVAACSYQHGFRRSNSSCWSGIPVSRRLLKGEGWGGGAFVSCRGRGNARAFAKPLHVYDSPGNSHLGWRWPSRLTLTFGGNPSSINSQFECPLPLDLGNGC
jgi:hypothetical protein